MQFSEYNSEWKPVPPWVEFLIKFGYEWRRNPRGARRIALLSMPCDSAAAGLVALAAGPDDWVALHSLDLAPWNRSLRTEIDFVVIVPDAGILCIEVKSHENITFDGHRWYPETIARSPFKQAADGRHEFYRRLVELAAQFKRVPIVHCCIFPKSPFDLPANLSVQPWELMDSRTFRSFVSGAEFCAELKARIKLSVAADPNLSSLATPLSRDQIDTLVKCCLPVQKRRPAAREEISRRQAEMEKLLRDQQKPVLQLAALNARWLSVELGR